MIGRFIDALRAADLDLGWHDLADVLWLADVRARAAEATPAPAAGTAEPSTVEAPDDVSEPAASAADARRTTAPEPPAAGPSTAARPAPEPPRRTPGWRLDDRPEEPGGMDVVAPTRYALPGAQSIGRALRPLKQRRRNPRRPVFDPEATVDRFCDTGVLVPVLRAGLERWFEVAVVADTTATMAVWGDTIHALADLLERHGAFRAVSRWGLAERNGHAEILTPSGLAHDPREIVDLSGRRLVLVVTDAVHDLWSRAPVWEALRSWGSAGPVALVQVLPYRSWAQTRIGGTDVELSATRPGQPNRRLDVSPPWWWPEDEAPADVVPVVALDEVSLAPWARMVMGAPGLAVPGMFAEARAEPDGDQVPGPVDPDRTADLLRASVSAEAYRLAVLLSAVEASLPVARIVMHDLLPAARTGHLAELVAAGVLLPSGEAGTSAPAPTFPIAGLKRTDVALRFAPGLRDLLQQSLTATATLDVWRAVVPYLQATNRIGRFSLTAVPADDGDSAGPADEGMLAIAARLAIRLGLAPTARTTATDVDTAAPPSSTGSDADAAAPPSSTGPDAAASTMDRDDRIRVRVERIPGRAALLRLLARHGESLVVAEPDGPAILTVALADDGSAITVGHLEHLPDLITSIPVTGPVDPAALADLASAIARACNWLRLDMLYPPVPPLPPDAFRLELQEVPSGLTVAPSIGPDGYVIASESATVRLLVRNASQTRLYAQGRILLDGYRTLRLSSPFTWIEPGEQILLGTEEEWTIALPPGSDRGHVTAKIVLADAPFVLPGDEPVPGTPVLGRDGGARWDVRDVTVTLTTGGRAPTPPVFGRAILVDASADGRHAGSLGYLDQLLTAATGLGMSPDDVIVLDDDERAVLAALDDAVSRGPDVDERILLVFLGSVVRGFENWPLVLFGRGEGEPEDPAGYTLDVDSIARNLRAVYRRGVFAVVVVDGPYLAQAESRPGLPWSGPRDLPPAGEYALIEVMRIPGITDPLRDFVDIVRESGGADGAIDFAAVAERLRERQNRAAKTGRTDLSPTVRYVGGPPQFPAPAATTRPAPAPRPEWVFDELLVDTRYERDAIGRIRELKLAVDVAAHSTALKLSRLRIAGLDAAERRLRAEVGRIAAETGDEPWRTRFPRPAADASPLDLLFYCIRHRTARAAAGRVFDLGRNRFVRSVIRVPWEPHRWWMYPEPATPPQTIGARSDQGCRVGLIDMPVFPHPVFADRLGGAEGSILEPSYPVPYWAGHATFVAGRILAEAAQAELVVRAVLDDHDSRATAWDVATALVAMRDAGAQIVSLSLGCFTEDQVAPLALSRAVEAVRRDLVIVAAAGNHGSPTWSGGSQVDARTAYWPAALPEVVAVGAVDDNGEPAEFSPSAPWISFLAPGVNVVSAFIAGVVSIEAGSTSRMVAFPDGWARWSSTSFAAATVAGRLAHMTARNGGDPHQAVRDLRREVQDAGRSDPIRLAR